MPNLPGMTIREMRSTDLAFAASCTAGEGWVSENKSTLEGFLIKDPHGCLLAEEHGHPVGICIATFYGKSGFIGELIVRPEARGRGVGASLLNYGVSVLKARRAETIYLDGVLKAVELYVRNGFRKVCRSWRFTGHLAGASSHRVRRMTVNDLEQVSVLDNRYFGGDRSFYLRYRLELFPELSYVMTDGKRITGYILGRGGKGWLSAGPCIAISEAGDPLDLLNAFALEAHERPISIGILDTNQPACRFVQSLGFEPRLDSPWRMALGTGDDLGASPQCFAIGSAAKG
ncbi:MAG TPA: GNAT family N-acetyltransferase [Anaerolineales bacterium]|nr:GNAT family N-acetyltransferase [Anaerolineales bacterium]